LEEKVGRVEYDEELELLKNQMETCVPKAMFSEITKKLASAQDVHFIRDNITQLMESLEAEYATTEAMLKQKREISSWVQD
jgi:hypothetical protein